MSQRTQYADAARKTARPLALEVVSILALAAVAGVYAYQHRGSLGRRAARRR